MKRLLGPFLLILLVIGVGTAIYFSVNQQIALRRVTTIHGLIGSEKEEFFLDPKVIAALRRGGLEVQVEKAGSRTIATTPDLAKYDFVFPSGVPAAAKLRQDHKNAKAYDAFFTPIAVASWKPIADLLVTGEYLENPGDPNSAKVTGMATKENGYYTLDMEKFLQAVKDGKRWKDIMPNSQYSVNKNILIVSTDVRKSNSAAMYLSLASFVANGNNVVQSDQDVQNVAPLMDKMFLGQGFSEYSSEAPFEDYLSMGMGKSPMVIIYEAQFISRAAVPNGISSDMVLMYPRPTVYSKHTLIALTAGGEKLGELLLNDPDLQRLAVEHGFRNSHTDIFQQVKKDRSLSLPDNLVDVVDSPSYEMLEKMIQQIESKYQ